MSVFNMSASDTNKLFLEYITPGLHTEIRENSVLYDRFDTDSDRVTGKYATFKCLTGATPGRPSSSSQLPTPVQGVYNEFLIYMKRGYTDTMQFDGLALACAKGKGAVMNILEAEMKGKAIVMANKLNQQFWNDGSGRLAQVVGAVSASTTVVVDGPLFGQDANFRTNPAQYLFTNQFVDIYSGAGVLEADSVQISAIVDNGDGTATLTMAEAVTCSDDAYIFDEDTYSTAHAAGSGVPMGLRGIVGTGAVYLGITPAYFQSIDRTAATNAWARAQRITNSSAVVSDANVLRLVMQCEKYGRTKVLITNEPIYRAWVAILKAENSLMNETVQWGGTEGILFYGGRKGKIPIIHDEDAPDNGIFALDDSVLKVFSPKVNGLEWIPGEKGILTQVQGRDEFTAQLMWYYNFGCEKPQSLGELYAVKHSST
jgi:hypothetical protein